MEVEAQKIQEIMLFFLDHLKDLGLFYMRVAVRASEEAEQWKRTQQ
jgi:hypothetical protein